MAQITQFPGGQNPDWRKFVDEIKKKMNGPSGPNPSVDNRRLLSIALVFFVLVGGFTSFYTIDTSEEGVITRLGRYVHTEGPGLHFKLPFWVDRVQRVPKRILQLEFGFRSKGNEDEVQPSSRRADYSDESLMLTGDLNVADVEWTVKYRIKDSAKFLFGAREVSRNIRDVSMSIMRRVVGDRRVGDVLTVGRVEIAEQVKVLMQELLDTYDIGIQIEQVLLQDVNPPDAVKPAFNEVNAAKQEQEQAINMAEREYNKVIPASRGKADQVIADAEAYAVDKINRASGDASRFDSIYKEYSRAPQITKTRMYLETVEKVFRKTDQLILVDKEIKGLLPMFMDKFPSAETTNSAPPSPTAK